MKLMYIHGYGSTGQAYKAQLLSQMFPTCEVVSPTFDYNVLTPYQVIEQLRASIEQERPTMLMGSSMGGYYALCCAAFYDGTIWCINPVLDILGVIRQLAQQGLNPQLQQVIDKGIQIYADFDQHVFQTISPKANQLHFALSTDDETLGSHQPLLRRFPNYAEVIWKDNCGHRFLRFSELQEPIAASLPQ